MIVSRKLELIEEKINEKINREIDGIANLWYKTGYVDLEKENNKALEIASIFQDNLNKIL